MATPYGMKFCVLHHLNDFFQIREEEYGRSRGLAAMLDSLKKRKWLVLIAYYQLGDLNVRM